MTKQKVKVKTKKVVKKRFKVTKTGKVLHRTQTMRHKRSKASKARQRRQDGPKQLSSTKQANMIKELLGV